MKNMQKMFGDMGIPMNGKLNINAMQAQMKNNIGKAKTKERLRRKLEARKKAKLEQNKDEQIKLLQQQLAAAKAQNQLLEEFGSMKENVKISKTNKRKKRKRKGKKK